MDTTKAICCSGYDNQREEDTVYFITSSEDTANFKSMTVPMDRTGFLDLERANIDSHYETSPTDSVQLHETWVINNEYRYVTTDGGNYVYI